MKDEKPEVTFNVFTARGRKDYMDWMSLNGEPSVVWEDARLSGLKVRVAGAEAWMSPAAYAMFGAYLIANGANLKDRHVRKSDFN